jgi:RNA polymerase sigma-70 factor (ECF subfamily)
MSENERELEHMLQGCRQNNRNSQQKLYEHFYGYAMSICLRYARGREEAL